MPGTLNVASPSHHFVTDPVQARVSVAAADVSSTPTAGAMLIPLYCNCHASDNQMWVMPKLVSGGTPGVSKCSVEIYGRFVNRSTGAPSTTVPDWTLLNTTTDLTDATMLQIFDLPALQCWIRIKELDEGTTWTLNTSFSWNTVERLSDKIEYAS